MVAFMVGKILEGKFNTNAFSYCARRRDAICMDEMRKRMRYAQHLAAAMGVIFMAGAFNTVSASLILVGPEDFQGTGLGAVNTILTMTSPGATTSEQGCVGRSTAGCPGGSTNAAGDVIGGTLGGHELTGASQTLTRSVSSLGIDTAANLRVVFNAVEPGSAAGESITLNDLVLNIYSSTGVLEFTSGPFTPHFFADTEQGVGNSGFVFRLDPAQAAAAEAFLSPTDLIGLHASATNATGGPETFFIARTTLVTFPEPASLLLFASGLACLGVWRWKKG
jgi:hypothetical protein